MISITNAGRGAGKTYQLIQWAKEDPNRRIVGSTATRNAMAEHGIADQFVFLREAKKQLQGRYDITGVAFDDFGHELYQLLFNEYGIYPEAEIILSMAVPERPIPKLKVNTFTTPSVGTRVRICNDTSVFDGQNGVVVDLRIYATLPPDVRVRLDDGLMMTFGLDEIGMEPF